MNRTTLKVDERSMEHSKSDQVTGVIFFDFGTRQFPEKRWNDFVVVILNWWLSALGKIMSGKLDSVELRFMDGPFFLRVKNLSRGVCNIECFEVGPDESAEYSEDVSTAELAVTLLRAAKKVESVCTQNGWDNSDIRELRRRIEKMGESLDQAMRTSKEFDN